MLMLLAFELSIYAASRYLFAITLFDTLFTIDAMPLA